MNNKTHCPDATPEFHLVNRYLGWGDRGKDRHRKDRHDGGLWFIGMEEATGCDGWTPQQVRKIYANKPSWTPTLPPSQWGSAGAQVRDYTCKIVRPLSSIALAQKLTFDQYRQDHLWRKNRQVCQTNVLPIGRQQVGLLPLHFKDLFGYGPGDWDAYIECVRHTRVPRLQKLWERYQPQAVVCFGKGYWRYHKEIFGLGKPTGHLDDDAGEFYKKEKVILAKFFGHRQLGKCRSERVSDKLLKWGVNIY